MNQFLVMSLLSYLKIDIDAFFESEIPYRIGNINDHKVAFYNVSDVANYIDVQISLRESKNS